jgi:adhesin/invasin
MFSRLALVCVALAAVFAAGCEKVPLLAPSASTIFVSAGATALAPGASTTITAVVSESGGTPVQNGTLVRFTATLGRIEPAAVETNGGVATATFTAGTVSGTAQIEATSGGATGGTGTTPTNRVTIAVGAAAATGVTVSANPSRVPSSGGTVTIFASAVDAAGNRLIGIPVTFSSDKGTLSSSSATTDSNGEARVSLTTRETTVVTARVGGGGTTSPSGTTTVSVGAAGTVTLTATPATPLAGAPVTLTITPAANTAPRVVVNWGDGVLEDLGIVAAARTATHVYQRSGPYTIAAAATTDGETFNTATSVTVGSAAAITLSDPPATAPLTGVPVTFTVTPTAGTSPRVIVSWGDGTQEDLGIVTGPRSVAHSYSTAGSYTVTATSTAGGDTFSASKVVTIAARPTPPPINVTVTDNRSGSPERCQPVTFTATPVSTATEPISSYEWVVDSVWDSERYSVTTTGNTLTRVFPELGTKTVSVTANTPDGREGNGQTQVVVKASTAVPPIVVCP